MDRPVRLLSLDGGGIRGLSELVILEEIMNRIQFKGKLVDVPLPADYFDMIGGTSTGGLVALLLGRLRMSATEALNAYVKLAKQVFGNTQAFFHDGKFKASNLEAAIKDAIEMKLGKGHGNDEMLDPAMGACKVFVCAAQAIDVAAPAGPQRFRTYNVSRNRTYNCLIWEAARATSAASTYFKSIEIGPQGREQRFIDAAVGCNNPVKEVIKEAEEYFGEAQKVSCILSIGTGRPGAIVYQAPKGVQKVIPTQLAEMLAEVATDTNRVAEEMDHKHANAEPVYWRLNVDQGLAQIHLEEWDRLGEVEGYTQSYLRQTKISQAVDAIVEVLTQVNTTQVRAELTSDVSQAGPDVDAGASPGYVGTGATGQRLGSG